jgi:tRNA(fMet)-specific endonuclease VapC
VIDYLNGREPTRKRLEELADSGLALSIISLAELFEGILYSNNPERNERGLRNFLFFVTVVNIDEAVCRLFGQERGRLRARGEHIGDFDLLIGATARQHQLILLTNNRRHFEKIEGLKTESLTP